MVSFEVLTAVVSRVVTLCVLINPENGDSVFLRNVCIYLQVHKALQPKRLTTTEKETGFGLYVMIQNSLVFIYFYTYDLN